MRAFVIDGGVRELLISAPTLAEAARAAEALGGGSAAELVEAGYVAETSDEGAKEALRTAGGAALCRPVWARRPLYDRLEPWTELVAEGEVDRRSSARPEG